MKPLLNLTNYSIISLTSNYYFLWKERLLISWTKKSTKK